MAYNKLHVVYPELCNRQQSETHVASPLMCRARAVLPASLPCRRCAAVEHRAVSSGPTVLALALFQEHPLTSKTVLYQIVAFGLDSRTSSFPYITCSRPRNRSSMTSLVSTAHYKQCELRHAHPGPRRSRTAATKDSFGQPA